jgi:hypothetical protein
MLDIAQELWCYALEFAVKAAPSRWTNAVGLVSFDIG